MFLPVRHRYRAMNDDWTLLKLELDRIEGRTLDFGAYSGWKIADVYRVDRGYLD